VPKGGLQFWHLLVIVLLAAMFGTAVGDILGKIFPDGAVGRFFAAGYRIGTNSPLDLDLRVLQITLGAVVRVSILGVAGAGVALLVFLRRL
jgi:uncharacterized protein DUF4321